MKRFRIIYDIDVTLTEEDLFPDGTDGLGEINSEMILNLIKSSGGMKRVIDDWNLCSHEELDVMEIS